MASLISVVTSECSLLPKRLGSGSGAWFYLIMLAVFGYLLPAGMGYDFLDPHLLLMYACSAPFFISSVVAESFGEPSQEPSTLTVLAGKVITSSLFGWTSSLVLLSMGLATINFHQPQQTSVLPEASFLAWIAMLGLSLSLFTVALAAALALSVKAPKSIKTILRRGYAWILIALIILARFGLLEWREAFTSLLTAEGISRLCGYGSLALAAATILTIVLVIRHPRYSGPVPSK
ncbi:MAG: hypothetical protein FJW20_04060 [Acidimicrobiia bacterium]|nr:hypothetical protein [Acidimicrobiia bacterium]